MVTCKICNHEQRYDIESALLNIPENTPVKGEYLSLIADEHNIDLNALKVHALMHMAIRPMVSMDDDFPHEKRGSANDDTTDTTDEDDVPIEDFCEHNQAVIIKPDGSTSLATQMKLREAEMLMAVANEYLLTLKTVGRKINSISTKVNEDQIDSDVAFARLITKPMVDLYIGAGKEIRETIKTIADVNQIINGKEDDSGSAGLKALAEALKASTQNAPQTLNFVNLDKEALEKNSTTFIVDDEDSGVYE